MYRTKSSISLKNLAQSIKESIKLDGSKRASRQFIPLRKSSSSMNLTGNNNANLNKKKQSSHAKEDYLMLLETRRSNKVDNNQVSNSQFKNDLKKVLSDRLNVNIQRKSRLLQMTRAPEELSTRNNVYRAGNAQPYSMQSNTAIPSYIDPISNALSILQQQHKCLSHKLHELCQHTNIKSYTKQLDEVQILSRQIESMKKKEKDFIEYKNQLINRLRFLEQQIRSKQMNFTEDVAQKEYCEEFLETYAHSKQHKQQALIVIQILKLQYETKHLIQSQIVSTQQKISSLTQQFSQWKQEQQLQLSQQKSINQLKSYRIQLMRFEQQLDHLTEEMSQKYLNAQIPSLSSNESLRKVREYVCAYFKKYNLMNFNHISHNQIADGIDLFLCKQGLIEEFTKFIVAKTQFVRLTNGIYTLKLQQYCQCLKKIQRLFSQQKTDLNNVLLTKYEEHLQQTKQKLQELNKIKSQNLEKIYVLQQQLDKLLAHDSLSAIQVLNKRNPTGNESFASKKQEGFWNFNQIRSKVKEIKIQQVKRVNKVKQIFWRQKQLQQKEHKYSQQIKLIQAKLTTQHQALATQIKSWSLKIFQLTKIKQAYELKRSKLEFLIDQAIQKMKQKDLLQNQIQSLAKQIQTLKKQKIQAITEKHQSRKPFQNFISLEQNVSRSKTLAKLHSIDTSKSVWGKLIPAELQTKNKLEIGELEVKQPELHDQNASAQFGATKPFEKVLSTNFMLNEHQSDIKTQSPSKKLKQRVSLGVLSNILLERCNLVQSKPIISQSQLKKSVTTLGLGNKQNFKFGSEQLLLQSKTQSLKNSARSKKKSIQTSTSKITQRNTLKGKIQSNRNSTMKLSLNTTNRKTSTSKTTQILKPYENNSDKNKKVNSNQKLQKTKTKDLNDIISSKMLRR